MKLRAQVGAVLLVALLPGCSTTVLLPWAPATIGPEWSEFRFDRSVRPVFRTQEIVLELDEPGARAQFFKGPIEISERPILLTLANGRNADVFAQAVMVDGAIRPLFGWGHWCVNDAGCRLQFGDRFTTKESITGIRLKASVPIKIKLAYWEDFTPP